jgi:hypothetical protein
MSQDVLHDIIRQKIAAMNIEGYYLRPARFEINQPQFNLELHNVVYVLNTKSLPFNYRVQMFSSDNVFVTTDEQYKQLEDLKYQIFTDYIQIWTTLLDPALGSFESYNLEFLKIIPSRSK